MLVKRIKRYLIIIKMRLLNTLLFTWQYLIDPNLSCIEYCNIYTVTYKTVV